MAGHSRNSKGLSDAWVVLGVTFITIALTQGTRSAYAVFMEPLAIEFGWNRATLSMPPAIAMAAFALTQPAVGRAIDTVGCKRAIFAGVILLGMSSLMLVWATQVWHFALLAGILTGIGAGASSALTCSVLLSGWFPARRGFALGIASSGISVGQAILAPSLALTIIYLGWRAGFGITALLLIGVNLPLVWLLLKEPNPADLLPLAEESRPVSRESHRTQGSIWREGLSSASFWWLNLGYFVCGFTDFFIYNHLVIYARDLGYSETTAASGMSVVAVSGIVGTLVTGAWSDKTSPKILMGWSYVSRALGFVLLGFAAVNPGAFFAFSFLTGASFLATIPLTAMITRTIFGQRFMGTFYGIVSLSHQVGAAAGIYLGGLMFDIFRSYGTIFALGAILLIAAAIMSFLIREEPLPLIRRQPFPGVGPIAEQPRTTPTGSPPIL